MENDETAVLHALDCLIRSPAYLSSALSAYAAAAAVNAPGDPNAKMLADVAQWVWNNGAEFKDAALDVRRANIRK